MSDQLTEVDHLRLALGTERVARYRAEVVRAEVELAAVQQELAHRYGLGPRDRVTVEGRIIRATATDADP